MVNRIDSAECPHRVVLPRCSVEAREDEYQRSVTQKKGSQCLPHLPQYAKDIPKYLDDAALARRQTAKPG